MINIKELKKTIRKEKEERLEKENRINPEFISSLATQGGISFRDEKIVKTGDGFEACLYVYKYPQKIEDNWLFLLANQDDTIVTFDISNMSKNKVIQNIEKSMEEQLSRYRTAKTQAEKLEAGDKLQEAKIMHDEIKDAGIMKLLITRIYVSAKTLIELDEKIANIKTELDVEGYKSAISLNETKEDWQAILQTYDKQNGIKRKIGQEILASQLAIGNPFFFSSLDDPHGFYYGDTFANTGGSVFLDLFRKTDIRLSYNSVLIGKMGSGKSTMLKKMFLDRAARGDTVRVFDVTGEYQTLTKSIGGKIISLDGSHGEKLNALHIRKTDENMSMCYANHISMLVAIYRTLHPDASKGEVSMMKKLLKHLYISLRIIPDGGGEIKEDITNLKANDYPRFRDFLTFIEAEKIKLEKSKKENTVDYKYISDISLIIEDLVYNYGSIFDGYSTITDIYTEQIITFDFKKLYHMEPEILDAQLFITLALCWDNCINTGDEMRKLYAKKQIRWEDITRFILLFDESHKSINTNKLGAVQQVDKFAREARKYFGGICLASQNITDFVKSHATKEAVEVLRTLFENCTYKFIMQQDGNAKETLAKVFEGQITDFELKQVSSLGMGETILMISGDRNLLFQVALTEEEEEIFEGGA